MVIIKIKIVMAWSWKKINCSIRGEEAFCKFKALQVDISNKTYKNLFTELKSVALICHIRNYKLKIIHCKNVRKEGCFGFIQYMKVGSKDGQLND